MVKSADFVRMNEMLHKSSHRFWVVVWYAVNAIK